MTVFAVCASSPLLFLSFIVLPLLFVHRERIGEVAWEDRFATPFCGTAPGSIFSLKLHNVRRSGRAFHHPHFA